MITAKPTKYVCPACGHQFEFINMDGGFLNKVFNPKCPKCGQKAKHAKKREHRIVKCSALLKNGGYLLSHYTQYHRRNWA